MADTVLAFLQSLSRRGDVGWFLRLHPHVLASQPELASSGRYLEGVFAACGANDLMGLKRGLERYVVRVPPAQAHLLVKDLSRLFLRLAAEPESVKALASAPPIDVAKLATPAFIDDEPELEAWARAHGVAERLDDSALALAMVSDFGFVIEPIARQYSIRRAHLGDIEPKDLKLLFTHHYGRFSERDLVLERLRNHTSEYLVFAEQERRAWEERRRAAKRLVQAVESHEAATPRAKFVGWVESILEDARTRGVVPVAAPMRVELETPMHDEETWFFEARLLAVEGHERRLDRAAVGLGDWEIGELRGACSCNPDAHSSDRLCRHVCLLLDSSGGRSARGALAGCACTRGPYLEAVPRRNRRNGGVAQGDRRASVRSASGLAPRDRSRRGRRGGRARPHRPEAQGGRCQVYRRPQGFAFRLGNRRFLAEVEPRD